VLIQAKGDLLKYKRMSAEPNTLIYQCPIFSTQPRSLGSVWKLKVRHRVARKSREPAASELHMCTELKNHRMFRVGRDYYKVKFI